MKKLLVVVLALILCISLAGCQNSCWYNPQDNININYNNISSKNIYRVWMSDDTMYYLDTVLFSNRYYSLSGKRTERIPENYSGYADLIQVYDNVAYLADYPEGYDHYLHAYDLDTGTDTELITVTSLDAYFVLGQNLYYSAYGGDDQDVALSLHSYALADGTATEISHSILSFGVINNALAYVVQEDNAFSIFIYDPIEKESVPIGKFERDATYSESVSDCVNFTSQYVVFVVEDYQSGVTKLVVYHLESGEVSEITIEDITYDITAYEEYVFVTTTDYSSDDSNDWESFIYRICLKDGTKEQIGQLYGGLNIYVTSDECVYVLPANEDEYVYRYDLDGSRTRVCKW